MRDSRAIVGVKGAPIGSVPEEHKPRFSGYVDISSDAFTAYLDPYYVDGYKFYYQDHLGSTRRLSNSGVKINYYPYGAEMTTAGTETDYKFTGKERDSATGLDYFGARYYMPEIGRWLVPDAMAHKYPTLSPYCYAANNPLVFKDPNGMYLTGDSTQLASIAEVGNEKIAETGIDNASLKVEPRTVKKTGLSLKIAESWLGKKLGLSLTTEVYTLNIIGSGWDELNSGLVTTGNDWQDKGLNGLADLLLSDTEFQLNIGTQRAKGPMGTLDGNIVNLKTREQFSKSEYDFFAVFMEEFVGHGHPNSPNSPWKTYQGGNLIGNAFGNSGWHDHGAALSIPKGGYNGYPVNLHLPIRYKKGK